MSAPAERSRRMWSGVQEGAAGRSRQRVVTPQIDGTRLRPPVGRPRSLVDSECIGRVAFSMLARVRSRWIGAFLGALWSAAVVAPPGLIACPMVSHADIHATATVSGNATAAQASVGDHAHHAPSEHAAERVTSTVESSGERTHDVHPCDCLGSCCGSAPQTSCVVSVAIVAAQVAARLHPAVTRTAYLSDWNDFVLPFATAPPTSVIG